MISKPTDNFRDSKVIVTVLHCWANVISALQLREQTPLDFDSSGLCLIFAESGEQLLSSQPSDFKYLSTCPVTSQLPPLDKCSVCSSASQHQKAKVQTACLSSHFCNQSQQISLINEYRYKIFHHAGSPGCSHILPAQSFLFFLSILILQPQKTNAIQLSTGHLSPCLLRGLPQHSDF